MKSLRDILKDEGLSEEQIERIEAREREGGSVMVAERPDDSDESDADNEAAEELANEALSDPAALTAERIFEPVSDDEGFLEQPSYESEENQKVLVGPIACARAKITRPWQLAFIDELAESGNLTKASLAGNLSQRSCERWKAKDPAFREAWEAAQALHVDAVEETVLDLAKAGDQRLAEFVLKSRRRHVYGDKVDVSVSGGLLHAHLSQLDVESVVARLSPLMSALAPLKVIENGGGK